MLKNSSKKEKSRREISSSRTECIQEFFYLLTGVSALGIGLSVYFLCRQEALFGLPTWDLARFDFSNSRFDWVNNNLPTFCHTLGFIFLFVFVSGGATTRPSIICMAWLNVELAFEFLQHPSIGLFVLENLSRLRLDDSAIKPIVYYVKGGTFDALDCLAAGIGAIVAYAFITGAARLLPTSAAKPSPGSSKSDFSRVDETAICQNSVVGLKAGPDWPAHQ